jgi:hypothetical protein
MSPLATRLAMTGSFYRSALADVNTGATRF